MTKQWKIPVSGYSSLRRWRRKHVYPITPDEVILFLDQCQGLKVDEIIYTGPMTRNIIVAVVYEGEIGRDRMAGMGFDPAHYRANYTLMRLDSVTPDKVESVQQIMRKEVLPRLYAWLREAKPEEYNWRRNDHNIVFRLKKGQLMVELNYRWA